MGKKDEIINGYLGAAGRFCDFFNGAVFGGQQVLKEGETTACGTVCRTAGTLRRQRDVCMRTRHGGSYVVYAVENQTAIHYGMVVRTMLMDAMEYDRQMAEKSRAHKKKGDLSAGAEYLSGLSRKDRLYPVLTVVFYYGEEPWDGSRSLWELLEFPRELEPYRAYFPDYPLLLIEPGQLQPENFKTEWRTILTMLKLRDRPGEFAACLERLREEEPLTREGLLTAAALLEDDRLLEVVSKEEEAGSMCKAIDYMLEKAENKGLEEGRQEGRQEGIGVGRGQMMELLRRLSREKRVEEFLAQERSPEQIEKWMERYLS